MNENTTVSVVMITYGHENYIEEAIKGVYMQQTGFPVELIIANDNSPDQTDEVVKNLIEKAPGNITVKYTKHDSNKGMMPNFLWAIEQAQGKYIAFCEGDDYWTDPLKLQKQVFIMEHNSDVGLCYTDIDIYNETGKDLVKSVFKNGIIARSTNFEDHLQSKGYLAPLTWLIRKDIMGLLLPAASAVDGTFEIVLNAYKLSNITYIDEVTGVKNQIMGSASNCQGIEKIYSYHKGLFRIQQRHITKYDVKEPLSKIIYTSAFCNLLPMAIVLKDDEFISETQSYFLENGMAFQEFYILCERAAKFDRLAANKYLRIIKKSIDFFK